MAAVESLSPSDKSNLDRVLRPHLRLDSQLSDAGAEGGIGFSPDRSLDFRLDSSLAASFSFRSEVAAQKDHQRGAVGEEMRSRTKPLRPSVTQGTLESDNKRRPAILKRNSTKFAPPPPEPPDPNSEAKSAVIRRMQSNLEGWEKQLQEICDKKEKNDSVQMTALEKRSAEAASLSDRLETETTLRQTAETHRNRLAEQLEMTDTELSDHRRQAQQLQSDLSQYEIAYTELETNRNEIEQQLLGVSEQLQQSEGMRRRLNDQVTELQGQLAIEEQRSKICVLL